MMDAAARKIALAARRVAALQVAAGAVVAAGFFVAQGPAGGAGAAYGAAAALLVTFLLGRGVARAAAAAGTDRGRSLRILYMGAAARFFLILGLFAAGLWLLQLPPLALVSGFAAGQAAYLLRARALR